MSMKNRIAPIVLSTIVAVALNLALVLPVLADDDGYDADERGGWFLPIGLLALALAAGIGGLLYWRGRRSQTPQG
jgi:hypothetical protein